MKPVSSGGGGRRWPALLVLALLLAACAERAEEINLWEISLGDAAAGEQKIQEYGCPACHVIPGIPGANGMVGPPLVDWSERHYIAGNLSNLPENLVRWIMNPQEVEPGTAMPDMDVTEEDARDIAAYLYSLGDGLTTASGGVPEQPVPFSHQYHVEGIGIDCRYCHTSVADSSFAGMPSTRICMACHSQILVNSPLLAGVRQSWEHDAAIPWVRLHDLRDSVHFHHGAHLQAGVGCDTCHGRVDQMQVTEQAVSMTMAWCLECHREPEQFLRPREEVFNLGWEPPPDQEALGARLVREYEIPLEILTDCSVCHY